MSNIAEYVRGDGPLIEIGYRRGDTWVQLVGPHADCEKKIVVIGPGIGRNQSGVVGRGVLVRCGGCFWSWVIR